MIEFVSIYLGLLFGVQPVEVVVAQEVAKVEIVLDGETVATMESAPWRATVDFGPRLEPRRLAAIALDDKGEEIGRSVQLLNLPRPSAEAGIVLERSGGRVVAARLTWQSVASAQPQKVTATLDGTLLEVSDPHLIAIPPHAADHQHVLVVDLEFGARDQVQVVAGFGGAFGEAANSDLTAVPIRLSGRRQPDPAALNGAVLRDGEPASVVSVEQGGAEILFVRDHDADKVIEELGRRSAGGVGGYGIASPTGIGEGAAPVAGVDASPLEELRRALTLDSDDRIRMIWPATKRVRREDVQMDLFPASPPFSTSDGGFFWALTQDVTLSGVNDVQRLTDAVAVAGLAAAAGNRRRAVVLVLGADASDDSQLQATQVQSFLHVLRVPLYVWTVSSEDDLPVPDRWRHADGTATISSFQHLKRAVRGLEDDLQRQRILWVEGRYLPQELTVVPNERIAAVVD